MATKAERIIDVDEYARVVDRLEGKLSAQDIAYLRALTARLLAVREELRSSGATMDRVRRLMRGEKP
jgi:hypothetical protein